MNWEPEGLSLAGLDEDGNLEMGDERETIYSGTDASVISNEEGVGMGIAIFQDDEGTKESRFIKVSYWMGGYQPNRIQLGEARALLDLIKILGKAGFQGKVVHTVDFLELYNSIRKAREYLGGEYTWEDLAAYKVFVNSNIHHPTEIEELIRQILWEIRIAKFVMELHWCYSHREFNELNDAADKLAGKGRRQKAVRIRINGEKAEEKDIVF